MVNDQSTKHSLNDTTVFRTWVVEDDLDAAQAIQAVLNTTGSKTEVFHTGKDILAAISAGRDFPDIICLDLSLPDMTGLELLPTIKKFTDGIPIIVVTSNNTPSTIEQAVQLGIYDYLPKKSSKTKFTTTFRRAAEFSKLNRRLSVIQAELEQSLNFGLHGTSTEVKAINEKIKQLASIDVNVLLVGAHGTGKELVARTLHNASRRKDRPFITINCTSRLGYFIESELFGHTPGAFAGANKEYSGAIEQANTGTLFLNQIEQLDISLQSKLLKTIQERTFTRLGSSKLTNSDFRLIVACNQDLKDMVANGQFNQDLYHQISVAEIKLPKLSERSTDINLLAHHFTAEFCKQLGKQISLSKEVCSLLTKYSWPTNVKELRNVIQVALIQCQGPVLYPEHLPERFSKLNLERLCEEPFKPSKHLMSVDIEKTNPISSLDEQERELIIESLRATRGKIVKAAKLLGLSRATLYRKIKKYDLSTRGTF